MFKIGMFTKKLSFYCLFNFGGVLPWEGVCLERQEGRPHPQESRPLGKADPSPEGKKPGNAVNERTVRILLECIFVFSL